jgi:chaperonin cofactor prefoldin
VRQDAEPAAKRLKRLEEGSLELQAQAAKAQVRVKQEKAEVTDQLEDTQDDYQMQINFTDKQQTMVDEMAKLALAHGASPSDVNKIRRPA